MKLLAVLLFFIAVTGIAFGQRQPTFYARIDYDNYIVCPGPQGRIQVADFNRDGIPDLLCTTIQLGKGDGTFTPGPAANLPGTALSSPYAVDVNGDGTPDLVYASNQSGFLGLNVMLGNGDATFQPAAFYPSTSTDDNAAGLGDSIVFSDFNGDGVTDAVLLGTSEYIVFLGRTEGSFRGLSPVLLPSSMAAAPQAMAEADFTGDGRMDLIVTGASSIEVLRSKGDGTFTRPTVTPILFNAGTGELAAGDLNGDGIPDVAVQGVFSNVINVYFGKRDRTFNPVAQPVALPGNSPFLSFAIADLNGDRIPDLVSDDVAVAYGIGDGTFAPSVQYAVDGYGNGGLGIGDLRGNGHLDLVVQDNYGLSILLTSHAEKLVDGVQTTVPSSHLACSASGDFDGDGVPDLVLSDGSNLFIYLGTGIAMSPFRAGAIYSLTNAACPVTGDLNNDGKTDILLTSGTPTTVTSYLGNGDGTFDLGPASPIPASCTFSLADFDADGRLDYVTSTNLIAYGNGDGSFSIPVAVIDGESFGTVATADMNRDGRPDVIATIAGGMIAVLLNTGDGAFYQTTAPECLYEPYRIAIGDVNGDGWPDVALGCSDQVNVYLNRGKGTLAAPITLRLSLFNPGVVAIADVNGDGIPDVEMAGTSNVAVFLNQGLANFEAPIFVGAGNETQDLKILNTHRQTVRGIPDLVVTDATGTIYDLINQTR